VEYNIRCDALANVFINEHRGEQPGPDDNTNVPWD
jgi:hypothetical protein